jgi:hypothetical protein
MALTLSQARQKLFKYVSPTLDSGLVTDRINSALERIYNSGKWKGLMATVAFNSIRDPDQWWGDEPVQYLTLPRRFQSVLGIQFGAANAPAIPRQIYPRWQEYIAGGAGQISSGTSMQMAVDLGDGFPTYATPTAPFHLRFEISDPQDVGKVVKFSAMGPDGNTLFNTNGDSYYSITLTSAGVTCPVLLGKITEIHKPITEGSVRLLAVSPADATKKAEIADYEATETVPSYKRYKLGASEFSARINCYCKRRYVELVDGADDETVIVPGNEGALKLTLMALQYEDKNDIERAEEYFNKALQLLNAELKEDMGAPVITLQMNPLGAAMRIPARF